MADHDSLSRTFLDGAANSRSSYSAQEAMADHDSLSRTFLNETANSQSGAPGHTVVSIKNLQLPHGVVVPDVWGKPKEQPALVSVTLSLKTGFHTAAQQDALDDSTIHYGQLAKRIRGKSVAEQTAETVVSNVAVIVGEMGVKAGGRCIISQATIEINMPKASMSGDMTTLAYILKYDENDRVSVAQRIFTVQNVKIMTLIGVNAYERGAKQPLVASMWLYLGNEVQAETDALFQVEQMLVQVIQDTQFETLESLIDFTVKQLQSRMLDQTMPGAKLRLRLEKPKAIPFADAPAVEVFRQVPRAT